MQRHRGEVEGHIELGLSGQPVGFIIHGHQPELSWLVWEVLEKRAMPYPQRPARDSSVVVDWFRIRVGGPLPRRPSEYGNFVMIVCRYADDPPGSWWISPETARPVPAAPDEPCSGGLGKAPFPADAPKS
jgi:hypothetical protein